MICAKCKKHRDLDAQSLCRLCSVSGRTSDEIAVDLKSRETIRVLKRETRILLRDLQHATSRADLIEAALASEPFKPITRTLSGESREAAFVVHLSDWHIGEVVPSDKVNDLNSFDLETADARIDRVALATKWLVEMYRLRFDVPNAIVILGGDMMTGYIHEELMESNSLSPTEEVLWLLPRLEELIRFFAEDLGFERVDVLTNYGNHGRCQIDKRISTGAENSYEWLMYQILNRRFANHPVASVLSTKASTVYHEVYGHTIRSIHGDELSFQGGVGGITIPLNKLIARLDQGVPADSTWLGHWHQYAPSARSVVNGSLKGYDTYSLKRGFAFEPPRQATALIDSKHGLCMHTPIWLG